MPILSPAELASINDAIGDLDRRGDPILCDHTTALKIIAGLGDEDHIGECLMSNARVIRLVETGLLKDADTEVVLGRLDSIRNALKGALSRQARPHWSLEEEEDFRGSTLGIHMY